MKSRKEIAQIVNKVLDNPYMYKIQSHTFFDEVYLSYSEASETSASEATMFFDGTDDIEELKSMLKVRPNHLGIHGGTYETYKNFSELFYSHYDPLKTFTGVTNIVCYSRGVYGYLFALDIAKRFSHLKVNVYLFGVPPILKRDLLLIPNNVETHSYRIWGDIVPFIYPGFSQVKVNKLIKIGSIITAIKSWLKFKLNHHNYFKV